MALLFTAAVLLQESCPFELLNDDAPSVRDEAYLQIAALGSEAIPKLKSLLDHPYPEVRLRAGALLRRLPEYAWERLSVQAEYNVIAQLWDGAIDAVIAKRPIPKELWIMAGGGDFGVAKEQQETLTKPIDLDRRQDHSVEWIAGHLLEEGARAVLRIGRAYGMMGDPIRRDILKEASQKAFFGDSLPINPLETASALGAGSVTLEEVCAVFILFPEVRDQPWINELSERDWRLIIEFLVRLRCRPGELPVTPDEALKSVSQGPWVCGIADGIGRAFVNGGSKNALGTVCRIKRKERFRESPWGVLWDTYEELGELEEELGRRFFTPGCLRNVRPSLPTETVRKPDDYGRAWVEKLNLERDARRVAEAIVASGALGSFRGQSRLRLLRAIAQETARVATSSSLH